MLTTLMYVILIYIHTIIVIYLSCF